MGTRNTMPVWKQTLLVITAIVCVPSFFIGTYKLFEVIDCNTAQKNLTFLNACIANENCTLNARETQRIESWTRLKLARCHKID